MNCDKKNRISVSIGITLLVVFSLAIFLIRDHKNFVFANQGSLTFIFTTIFFLSIILYFVFCKASLYTKSLEKSIQYPQSDNLLSNENHVGIIFPVYTDFAESLIIVDCVALLIDGFKKSNKKYHVYHIFKKEDFENAYYHKNVTELWILGHGRRGSISYGNKGEDKIEYSKLNLVDPKKQKIFQLHCNYGNEPSLKEINKCDGFVSESFRTSYYNRGYIIDTFKK